MIITHCSLITVSTCFHALKIIIRESFNLVHTFIQNGYDTDSTVAQLVWVNILAEMSLTTLCIEGWGLGAGVPQPLHLDQVCILMRRQNSCIILYYLEFDFPINPITLLGISSPGDFDVFQKQHLTYNHTTIRLRRYAGHHQEFFQRTSAFCQVKRNSEKTNCAWSGNGVFYQWCYKIQFCGHQENFRTAWIWFAFATRDFQKIFSCRRLQGGILNFTERDITGASVSSIALWQGVSFLRFHEVE